MARAGLILDSEEAKSLAVVHKTNQGYSGKDLYKLKQERPDLFGAARDFGSRSTLKPAPSGFDDGRELPGFLYNRERALFFNQEDGKLYCRDPNTGELYEQHRGEDISSSLSVRGDAATASSSSGPPSRHVMIGDLHRAASSMKLDFTHHDSPAAMFAVYDAGVSGGAAAEAAAKGLHIRLLPRLASYRGRWQNDRLEAVVAESIEALAQDIGSTSPLALAVALLLGGRLILAACGGAACTLFGRDSMTDGSMENVDVTGDKPSVTTHCAVLEDSHMGVLLTVNAVRAAGLSQTRLRALTRSHVSSDRPRAACATVLAEAQKSGAEGPLVAAAARLTWTDDSAPASKRSKTDGLNKVRCRHILLRFSGCQSVAGDRRAKATRPAAAAESQLLSMLPELCAGGPSAFTARCKAVSECDTALRGGDLSGDLGWLDKDPAKNKKVPAAVVKAAFLLSVGQISDIVTSERGFHLLLRTA